MQQASHQQPIAQASKSVNKTTVVVDFHWTQTLLPNNFRPVASWVLSDTLMDAMLTPPVCS